MRITENFLWELLTNGSGAGMSIVGNVGLEGPEGMWTGPAFGLGEDGTDGGPEVHDMVMILSGEGAYDGLSAMFTWEFRAPRGKPTYTGYIFDGELPPMPDAPEAPDQ
jgi:hypothetical protein